MRKSVHRDQRPLFDDEQALRFRSFSPEASSKPIQVLSEQVIASATRSRHVSSTCSSQEIPRLEASRRRGLRTSVQGYLHRRWKGPFRYLYSSSHRTLLTWLDHTTRWSDGVLHLQTFAIKLLSIRSDPAERQRFQEEGLLLEKLRHPNIVGIEERSDYAETQCPYIVMEYCSGGDLRKTLDGLKTLRYGITEVNSVRKLI